MSVLYPEPSFWKTIFSSSAPEVAFQSPPLNMEKVGSLPTSLHCPLESRAAADLIKNLQKVGGKMLQLSLHRPTTLRKTCPGKGLQKKKPSDMNLCFWDFCVQIFIQGQRGLLQKEKWLSRTCVCIVTLFQTTEGEEYPSFDLKKFSQPLRSSKLKLS